MMNRSSSSRTRMSGVTLVELMIVMVIGLIISIAVGTLFLSSTGGARRQSQLGNLQQSVRTAFDYLAHDARMVGHQGCYTGRVGAGTYNNSITPADSTNAYAIGVEGYEYRTGTAFTLASATPANTTNTGNFETNVATPGTATLPLATFAGAGSGLTPGSDVLVIRTVSGGPIRLSGDAAGNSTTISIEDTNSGGTCSNGTTAKVSGFCTGSHGLIASCTTARVFSINALAGGTLTLDAALGPATGANPAAVVYPQATAEVFPLHTIVYYVKASSNGRTTSLYRRIFDGDVAGGLEQELIEGVEMLQVRYGVDITTPDADGVIDEYRNANAVADWNRVVSIRMGLLIRASDALDPGVTVGATGVVNGVTVTYPTTDRSFDRRLFTTTVAVRNRISYF
ncbi:MAG: PilW family protein [Rhizobacter sp.]